MRKKAGAILLRGRRWHVANVGGGYGAYAACGFMPLDEARLVWAEEVKPEDRCKNTGCKREWPRWVGEPRRWVSWNIHPETFCKFDVPNLGVVEGGNFYHWGGDTYMPFDLSLGEVIEYGSIMDIDDDGYNAILARFAADNPPVQGSADEAVSMTAGWIHPDGRIYPCHYAGHRNLGQRLCGHFEIVVARTPEERARKALELTDPEDALLKDSWVRFSPALISCNLEKWRITRPQRRAIESVMCAAELRAAANKLVRRLADECQEFLDRMDR